jgi:hypothetical protein
VLVRPRNTNTKELLVDPLQLLTDLIKQSLGIEHGNPLLDHPVRPVQHRLRNRQVDLLRRLQIDHQLDMLASEDLPSYTTGMKTAISIPDKLYADAERFSRRRKKSRSRLYVEAVEEYLARHDPDEITEAMNQVCKTVDTRSDPAVSAASRRTLKRVEW